MHTYQIRYQFIIKSVFKENLSQPCPRAADLVAWDRNKLSKTSVSCHFFLPKRWIFQNEPRQKQSTDARTKRTMSTLLSEHRGGERKLLGFARPNRPHLSCVAFILNIQFRNLLKWEQTNRKNRDALLVDAFNSCRLCWPNWSARSFHLTRPTTLLWINGPNDRNV